MTTEERLKKREELKKKKVKFGDDDFDKHLDELLSTYTSKELLEELKEYGLEANEDER